MLHACSFRQVTASVGEDPGPTHMAPYPSAQKQGPQPSPHGLTHAQMNKIYTSMTEYTIKLMKDSFL